MGRIDTCVEIASHPEVIFCTFGDAMRVPGKNGSLLQAKARGADVRIVYSPLDALTLAKQNPSAKWSLASASKPPCPPPPSRCNRQKQDVSNFFFSASTSPSFRPCAACWRSRITVSTRSCAGPRQHGDRHRCLRFYRRGVPAPAGGGRFEPLDLLQGVLMLVEQKISARHQVENQYRRVVPDEATLWRNRPLRGV
jgi:hydrogenase expression/formation protein HypD